MMIKDETIQSGDSPKARQRLKAFLTGTACLIMLISANRLKPETAGIGTHRQLNLPQCGLYQRTGYPCPTCGITTAFALGAQAHFWQALITQPLGAALAMFVWIALGICIAGLIKPVFLRYIQQKLITIHFRLDSRFASVHGIWWFYGLIAAGTVLACWLVVCWRVRFA